MKNKKAFFKQLFFLCATCYSLLLTIADFQFVFMNRVFVDSQIMSLVFANDAIWFLIAFELIRHWFGGHNKMEGGIRNEFGLTATVAIISTLGLMEYDWFPIPFFLTSLVATSCYTAFGIFKIFRREKYLPVIPSDDERVWIGYSRKRQAILRLETKPRPPMRDFETLMMSEWLH